MKPLLELALSLAVIVVVVWLASLAVAHAAEDAGCPPCREWLAAMIAAWIAAPVAFCAAALFVGGRDDH
jgi:hypothetical protein